MNKIYLVLLILTTCSNKKEVLEYWPDGKLKTIGFEENGKRIGKWTYYRGYNQDTNYVDYYEDGVLVLKDFYTYVRINDSTVTPTTKLTTRTEYNKDSIKHGIDISFDTLGRIASKGTYVNGRINGEFFSYDSLGEVYASGEYLNDTIIKYQQYYENGNIQIQGDNPRDGMFECFDTAGNYKYKIIVKNWASVDTIP